MPLRLKIPVLSEAEQPCDTLKAALPHECILSVLIIVYNELVEDTGA